MKCDEKALRVSGSVPSRSPWNLMGFSHTSGERDGDLHGGTVGDNPEGQRRGFLRLHDNQRSMCWGFTFSDPHAARKTLAQRRGLLTPSPRTREGLQFTVVWVLESISEFFVNLKMETCISTLNIIIDLEERLDLHHPYSFRFTRNQEGILIDAGIHGSLPLPRDLRNPARS